MTDAFKQIGFQSGTGGGYGTNDIVSDHQNMSNSKDNVQQNSIYAQENANSPIINRNKANGSNNPFFMTETENFIFD